MNSVTGMNHRAWSMAMACLTFMSRTSGAPSCSATCRSPCGSYRCRPCGAALRSRSAGSALPPSRPSQRGTGSAQGRRPQRAQRPQRKRAQGRRARARRAQQQLAEEPELCHTGEIIPRLALCAGLPGALPGRDEQPEASSRCAKERVCSTASQGAQGPVERMAARSATNRRGRQSWSPFNRERNVLTKNEARIRAER